MTLWAERLIKMRSDHELKLSERSTDVRAASVITQRDQKLPSSLPNAGMAYSFNNLSTDRSFPLQLLYCGMRTKSFEKH